MAKNKSFSTDKNNESSGISAEVPREQTIREIDTASADTNTGSEILGTDYTLSPVITVTKNETTLTKGDLKLQKVTVTEDVSIDTFENGGHGVSYAESQTIVQTNRQTVTRTTMSSENSDITSEEVKDKEDKHREKKSRIPQLRFKQTVEKVKKERRERESKEQPHKTPRRSSIPKLKDAKLVKKTNSIQSEPTSEETSTANEAKLEDEFDKIYEEIVDDKHKDIDDKILAVKIDDPEKIETKFEEIIHAYDSNDDNHLTQTEKLRSSKIPWRKKEDAASRIGSLADRIKSKNSAANSNLRDGGFKVSASTITTKRFSRGNSTDLSNIQKVDFYETIESQNGINKEVINTTIVTESIEDTPMITKVISRGIKREISFDDDGDPKSSKKIDNSEGKSEQYIKIEEIEEGGHKVTTGTITKQHIKTGIPIKPERANRSISKELNRRPPNLDDRDFVNRKVVKHEELKDGSSRTIIRETIVKESPVETERVTRGIIRSFSRDGKSITVAPKVRKEINIADETLIEHSDRLDTGTPDSNNDIKELEADNKKEVLVTEKITKESIKVGIPVYTKTTHSCSKGTIQNVEISKTIEWKQADEIRPKSYIRSYSENKTSQEDVFNKKFGPTVIKNETFTKIEKPEEEYVIQEIKSINDVQIEPLSLEKNDDVVNKEPVDVSKDTSQINEIDVDANTNNIIDTKNDPPEIVQEIPPAIEETEDSNIPVPDKDNNIENVTILKGNVSRLITQISVKESEDLPKKEIDVEEDLPKKKSVLSKIAMFEGKEPAEFAIKIKKCTIDKKVSTVTNEAKPKIVDQILKTQPKLDPIVDRNKDDITVIDGARRDFNNEPIIIDEVWKVQQQNLEKNSATHQVEDVRIILDTMDFKVSENSLETAQILPGKVEFDTNANQTEAPPILQHETHSHDSEDPVEPIRTLPGRMDFVHIEDRVEESQLLPGRTCFERNIEQPEVAVTLPARLDFIPNQNQDNFARRFSPEKGETKQNQEAKKPRVGKLDLNIWQKQVEVNKQAVGKGKISENKSQFEKTKILPARTVLEKGLSEVEKPKMLPGRIEIKSEDQFALPTILPGRVNPTQNIRHTEVPKTLPGRIDFVSNEGQLQVPVVLPETPLTKIGRIDFETQKSQVEVPVILPGKTELTRNVNTVEIAEILPETIDISNEENKADRVQMLPFVQVEQNERETPKILPGIIDFNINDSQVEMPTILPGKIDIRTDEPQFETPKTLPEYIDFNGSENKVEIARPLPGRMFFTQEKGHKPKELDVPTETLPEVSNNNKVSNKYEELDREILSDPELVDSEPEIKDTKETVMGKLKNKIYFITNKRAIKAANELKSSSLTNNAIRNNDSGIEKTGYQTKTEQNKDFDTKSDIELDKTYKSREDMKRAKSLAELDLGDAVKGQVQRMVYRIKSVDFDGAVTPRSRKISVKEMPRKCSVLEKIALFEGKAASTRPEKAGTTQTTENPGSIETTTKHPKNGTEVPLNETLPTPEQIYLRKVEDLSTAKIRYGKMEMLYLQLGNGVQMPVIALGTALMDNRLLPHIISAAIDLGYRAIDTAYVYGNEREVGLAIKTKIDDGTVRREDLYIMSKLWSTFHHPELVETACRASLEALGLEYFDLYMIHNPMSFKEGGDPIPKIATVLQFSEYDYLDAWFAMEKLVTKGLVRNIGVSNFNSQQIQRILDKGRIRPVVNQVECHPYLSQQRLQTFCSERNITLSCFAVLGSKGTPAEYKSQVIPVIDDPLVKVMASGLNVTAARLLVRYQIQSSRNVVVKASTAFHLWDVLQALTFQLEKHQVDALTALNRNKRIFTYKGMGDNHKNYPFYAPF